MQIKIKVAKGPAIIVNANQIAYGWRTGDDSGIIIMSDGAEIEIISGLSKFLDKLKNNPHIRNMI